MRYFKRFDNNFYTFDNAYDIIEKNNLKDVVMRVYNKFNIPKVEITWEMINEQKMSISIPVWAAKSDKWELWTPDYEKQELAENIGDWIENDLDFELDSRFWDATNMSIEDWWRQLEDHILIEEDHLEIMNFLKRSGRLQGWKERNRKYYNNED